ncbi:TetR/AcrR family transcriptional regulator C-terminal domain-containing protein [Corallococcus sp. bb12-1]|uniref:TetR/AcrR family transcriptional regulator C-terminal domain-containing protein n=1 Tax=Corallococcus sp. bb12-1 TaxID=2996784 RepID=UPI00227062CF|nr:TetR/AcrR family transcriptional regulator C-terminal domain-containing protein [Corallococcus sp. bb12-1]MCY1044511.1 TetR/AcrR family transcriptional regulator C-terminal domain-containing protein [Corallococcus sp. bb12-1]
MASHRSSAGDPTRTLELLWREAAPLKGQRGPKPGLTVDTVVATAVELADAEGLDAVTMRALAGKLGIAPMGLYTYVPGRAELIDLMLDGLHAGMARRKPKTRNWRSRLEAVAHDNRALFTAHAWLADVSTTRPPLGPGQLAKYEYELQALEGTGLGDVEQDAALTFVLGFVESCARAASDMRAARLESQMSDATWWQVNAPLLARMSDPERYPTASRVGTAAGQAHGAAYNPDHAFRFGLERVLDGLSALIGRAPPPKRSRTVARKTAR